MTTAEDMAARAFEVADALEAAGLDLGAEMRRYIEGRSHKMPWIDREAADIAESMEDHTDFLHEASGRVEEAARAMGLPQSLADYLGAAAVGDDGVDPDDAKEDLAAYVEDESETVASEARAETALLVARVAADLGLPRAVCDYLQHRAKGCSVSSRAAYRALAKWRQEQGA